MNFTIHAISSAPGRTYPTLKRLVNVTLHEAARELIRCSTRRACAVVLRDDRGVRCSVETAMDLHGLSSAERWHPQQWLAKQPAEKETL